MARDDATPVQTATGANRLLQVWLSPSFPVGAFAYSHGLEAAVARGLVTSRATLEDWLRALLVAGSIRNDVIVLAVAWHATRMADDDALLAVNEMALALQPSAGRYLETSQQGGSFVGAIAAAWPCAAITRLSRSGHAVAYPVAVGVAAAGHGIDLTDAAPAFALAFVQSLVSAAIRLSVIGQTDGQRVVASLLTEIEAVAAAASSAGLDDLGGAVFSSDLASLEHETLYSRIFRS